MASINDNLFTILSSYAFPHEIGCHILTAWGPVIARFSEKGLAELRFDDSSEISAKGDSVFRTAFLKWLEHFQAQPPATQWEYLAPTGTDFQKSVWRALLDLPLGQRTSYQELAMRIGRPKANRAVGSAVGANPICLLIPCHRIVQSSGAIGNYRWGADRKLALLDAEQVGGSDLLQLFR